MHAELMEILACPLDHAGLTLAVEKTEGDDIVSGTLTCAQCGNVYLIEDSVPNLLPASMG